MTILGIRPRPSGAGAVLWSPQECTGTVLAGASRKGEIGAALSAFRGILFQWLGPGSDQQIEHVVCCKWSSAEATEPFCAQIEMIGVARQICDQFSTPFSIVAKPSALKEVAGAARAPKSVPETERTAWMSKRLREGCKDRGLEVKNDIIAEAFAAVELFRSQLHPDHQWAIAAPLFTSKEDAA